MRFWKRNWVAVLMLLGTLALATWWIWLALQPV
jgi:hypothetical protein